MSDSKATILNYSSCLHSQKKFSYTSQYLAMSRYCIVIISEVQYGVRLVDGASENQGRLEVQISGLWGTVCDNFWDYPDADITCRQLGFSKLSSDS